MHKRSFSLLVPGLFMTLIGAVAPLLVAMLFHRPGVVALSTVASAVAGAVCLSVFVGLQVRVERLLHEQERLLDAIDQRLKSQSRPAERAFERQDRRQDPAVLAVVWRWFSFVLPRSTRSRVFEPSYQELLEDYAETRSLCPSRWARRWLAFCFTFRTVLMVLDCIRALVLDKLAWMLPSPVRQWWLSGPK